MGSLRTVAQEGVKQGRSSQGSLGILKFILLHRADYFGILIGILCYQDSVDLLLPDMSIFAESDLYGLSSQQPVKGVKIEKNYYLPFFVLIKLLYMYYMYFIY